MKIEKVKKLSPLERFHYWITERHSIYLKKESGKPKPWTDDVILQSYRFCNVRRMDDKVSRWLLENWYEPNFNHRNMVLACTLARQINNIDTLSEIGFPRIWNPKKVEKLLDDRVQRGLKNYSSAYMITANYGKRGREPETKQYQTVWRVCQPLYTQSPKIKTRTMRECWSTLLQFPGFSSFISGQVVADLRWAVEGDWKDKMQWAPMGPGSMRGLNRLHGRDLKFTLSQSQFEDKLSEVIELCLTEIPRKITKRLEAIDYQSCLCEFDKMERVLWSQGRPRQKYLGV